MRQRNGCEMGGSTAWLTSTTSREEKTSASVGNRRESSSAKLHERTSERPGRTRTRVHTPRSRGATHLQQDHRAIVPSREINLLPTYLPTYHQQEERRTSAKNNPPHTSPHTPLKKKKGEMSYFKVTLRRSGIGLPQRTRGVLAALGLRRRCQTVYHPVSPQSAGMILRVKELVDVAETDRALSSREIRDARRPDPGFWVERRAVAGVGAGGPTAGAGAGAGAGAAGAAAESSR